MTALYALEVEKLKKVYPHFTLGELSFSVEAGQIAGLIGRNGAGKSTTLKSIMRLIACEGKVCVFGTSFSAEEAAVKERIGYVGGGFRFYPNQTLGAVSKAIAPFYSHWDENAFQRFCNESALILSKKIRELSEGMKLKFALALALSHGAKLLLLDEPTSGLDPLSREDFCDTLLTLKSQGVTVLFSTQITSDLMRVADQIIYLSDGTLLANESLAALLQIYHIKRFASLAEAKTEQAIGIKSVKDGFEGLVKKEASGTRKPTLDEIMIHLEYAKRELI